MLRREIVWAFWIGSSAIGVAAFLIPPPMADPFPAIRLPAELPASAIESSELPISASMADASSATKSLFKFDTRVAPIELASQPPPETALPSLRGIFSRPDGWRALIAPSDGTSSYIVASEGGTAFGFVLKQISDDRVILIDPANSHEHVIELRGAGERSGQR